MGLNGTIPPHLGNLSFLACLDISNNSFHGSIPIELSNLCRLKYINFGQNNFSGEIPSWFGSFTILRSLFLYSNNFNGAAPSSLGYLSNWKSHIPSDMFDVLPKLKFPSLDYNNLPCRIPASLFKCKELEHLDLRYNSLEGSSPTDIRKLTMLKKLFLNRNNLAGCLGRSFNINKNQLEGSVPPSLLNYKDLKLVDSRNNRLHDTFPNWLGNLELQVLILRCNRFYGRIDDFDATFSLSHLRIIDLSDNDFNGYLPTKLFGNLNAIKDGNQKKVEAEYMRDDYYNRNINVYYDQSISITTKGLEREETPREDKSEKLKRRFSKLVPAAGKSSLIP
ncbi:receptor-like protein kinase [Durio zibethinus]|uniref:Receptor-like protein kinase n=1 Tax=Durio zibethinus TaxID=66656 RepID=A0A6P5WQR9_DURZI|nr:receptor-like protein kinase [Durio zibethinus]